ncbi:hypothetical protein [Companilactobacillus farciminis]|uniref:hypothetical protein n=1 Tax=Companilactobacillus farciminis TaxID=1612 RepID=UPI00232A85F4|nr:hypothetical protein [Companilactobacillus farciminis]WCG34751.1 hypothetical protein PML84_07700 [Companilactobacillus farciminis]
MNEYHWTPEVWINFNNREKALIIAGIDMRNAEEKKQQKEAERKAKSKSHR